MAEEIKGLVVKIQGSSFVDGPGVRTTIFLKGCPLRCLWCCDPEGQHLFPEKNKLYPEKGVSPIFGEWVTVNEVMETVAKDIPFYRASGGGVTIAGGEPTYRPVFCREFIKRCRNLGIHTALDTCGHTIDEEGVMALEEADLLLYDLKSMDPDEHERNTGVRNNIILKNFRRMVELKKDIIVRIPLIPGYTDTMKNIKATGDFLSRFRKGSIIQIDLLPYNRGGIIRYEMLRLDYPLDKNLVRQSDEYLQKIKQLLVEMLGESCPVTIGH
jgi:pyruvate formate lyase activating enzyme